MGIELRALTIADLPAARRMLAEACAFDHAAQVAEEKLFGPAPAATRTTSLGALDERGELVGVAVASARWIRLLAVAPSARGRGVGTALLAGAESAVDGPLARTMDQPGNYLAPGVAAQNQDTLGWLERRGYKPLEENTNLVIDLAHNPQLSEARGLELASRAAADGYDIRRAADADRASLAAAVALAFGRAWAFEIDRALDCEPAGVHIALHSGELAAFAAHDGNNRGLGWFGPAGTLLPHRGKRLGEALLLACLRDLADEGRSECTVAWIGPREFYQRAAGIAREERFIVLSKELRTP